MCVTHRYGVTESTNRLSYLYMWEKLDKNSWETLYDLNFGASIIAKYCSSARWSTLLKAVHHIEVSLWVLKVWIHFSSLQLTRKMAVSPSSTKVIHSILPCATVRIILHSGLFQLYFLGNTNCVQPDYAQNLTPHFLCGRGSTTSQLKACVTW